MNNAPLAGSKIIRVAADLLHPFCLIFGLYIVTHGHLTPGGGFQGGAVMATATALLLVAQRRGEGTGRWDKPAFRGCEVSGLMGLMLAGVSGWWFARPFLGNWLAEAGGLFGQAVAHGPNGGSLNTSGLVPLMNLAVGVEVFGGLTLILLYMLGAPKGEDA